MSETLAPIEELINPKLVELLRGLDTDEQETVLRQLFKVKERGRQVDSVSIFHESMKAGPNDPSMMVNQQELLSAKAPPVIKDYAGCARVPLTRDLPGLPFTLDEVIRARASRRDYAHEWVTLQELSALLHYSYGIRKRITAYNTRGFPVRFSPSSGGLQAVDLYLVANHVEDIRKGLYHYNADKHALELLNEGNMRRKIVNCCSYQEWIHHAGAVLILTCVMDRVEWKYGVRGYRYVHIDTGILAQNLCLTATALRLRTCAVAAYIDDAVNDLLEIDGRNEFVSLLIPVGKKPHAFDAPTETSERSEEMGLAAETGPAVEHPLP
jgi:SagB-type dehydrogenase family enzyme